MRTILIMSTLLLAAPAVAQEGDSLNLANELGSIIAAEDFCGLTYDQAAIATFIETRVAADDMSFPSMLKTMTDGHKFQQQAMSASAKTANCTQVRRLAKSFGFVQ